MGTMVLIETTSGEMLFELFDDKAPKTVANFMEYVDEGFYEDTIFHRVINDFMIQGGGYGLRLDEKKTKAPIENEATNMVKNLKNTIAMARTSEPHSATAQFFINLEDNEDLDHVDTSDANFGYCVFGELVDGEDVLTKIRKLKTKAVGEHGDVPLDAVLILKITRFE